MSTYVLQGEERQGPFTDEELQGMVAEGRLSPEDLAWREGMTEWQPLASLLAPAEAAGAVAEPGSIEGTEEIPSLPDEPVEGLASPRLLALLEVYGIEHAPRITKEVALALLTERDLSKPVPASAWQEYQRKFPPSTKKRTRSERVDWLLEMILEEHDTSYWSPDHDSVREILEYMDHRFKGWEMRVNAYDLIDRGIRAFYPPPTKRMLAHEEAKKSIVVEMRTRKARKAHFLEGLGISILLIGLFLIFVFGRAAWRHQNWQDFLGAGGGLVLVLLGIRALQSSRRAEQ